MQLLSYRQVSSYACAWLFMINECLMQSYNGIIRFFPNWPKKQDASFHTLRAAGAFLVSVELRHGIVTHVRIMSEKGNDLHMLSPWKQPVAVIRGSKKTIVKSTEIYLKTSPGEVIVFQPD
jgi:alpha-L-fucosidase 2